MLTGAGVRGCKYSGCSKCAVCAVSILRTRMGSRFACRSGSRGANRDTAAPGRGSVLSLGVAWSSMRVLADPEGRYFIGDAAALWVDARHGSTFSPGWCLRLVNVIHAVTEVCRGGGWGGGGTKKRNEKSHTQLDVLKCPEGRRIL